MLLLSLKLPVAYPVCFVILYIDTEEVLKQCCFAEPYLQFS